MSRGPLWSAAELDRARQLRANGLQCVEIDLVLGRPPGATADRLNAARRLERAEVMTDVSAARAIRRASARFVADWARVFGGGRLGDAP